MHPSFTTAGLMERRFEIDFETENFVSSVDFSKSILFFESDSTGKFITIYIKF